MGLLSKIKWALIVLLLVGAFVAGTKWGSVNTTVVKEVKGETKVVYKDRIVTVTKIVRPDGTTEETTKTEEKEGSKKSKNSDTVAQVYRPKYSLGLIASSHVERDGLSIRRVTLLPGVTAGYNIFNNTWVKFSTVPADNIYTLGIEIHF